MKIFFLDTSTSERRDMILYNGISKTLMLLTMPSLMMGLIQPTISLSDGLFINNIAGPYVANIVTYCVPILNMVVALSQGLGSMGMAVISQASGHGDFVQGKKTSSQLILLASLLGIVSILAMILLAFPISAIITKEISDIVWLHLVLNAFVMSSYSMEVVYNVVKNVVGQPEAIFVWVLLLLLLKILSNSLSIYLVPLGITGCVISSMLSNMTVCVIMFYELFVRESEEKFERSGAHLDREIAAGLLRIGLLTMLSSVTMNLGFYLINNEVQKYGAIALNGQGIANNITNICFAMTGVFGPTVTTMVSMNTGAGKKDRTRRSMWIACGFSALTAVVLIAPVVPFVGPLTGLFARNQEVLDMARTSLYIYIYSTTGFGVCMVQQGILIGLGHTRTLLVISILRIWLLCYLFILATKRYLGVLSVFWGNLFPNLTVALTITLMVLRMLWESVLSNRASAPQEERGQVQVDLLKNRFL